MGLLLDRSINPAVKMGASDTPWGIKPLCIEGAGAQNLAEETAAAQTLRTYEVRAIACPKPTREVRDDLLRSGYAPGSAGDRAFAALHRVEVHGDRAGNGDDFFRGTNVKRASRSPNYGYAPGMDLQHYDDLKEAEDDVSEDEGQLAADILEIAALHNATIEETIAGIEQVQADHGLDLREALDALTAELPIESPEERRARLHAELTERVRRQLRDVREDIGAARQGKTSRGTRTPPEGGIESSTKPASAKAPEGSVGSPASAKAPPEGSVGSGTSSSKGNVRKTLKSIVARRTSKVSGATDHIDTRPETKRTSIGEATLESFAAAYRKVGAR